MTEDYKTKLLAYMCGKYQVEKGKDEPQFLAMKQITTNLDTQLKALLGSYTIKQRTAFQAKDAKGNLMDKYYIYGTHGTSDKRRGFIALLDKNFNLLKCITKYATEVVDVEIGPISALNVDEEGYVSIVETNVENNQIRFIMLNNIAIILPNQDYKVKIRKALNLQDPIQTTDASINFIFKKEGSSNYAFVAWLQSNEFVVQTLEVQVGTENTWKNYTYTASSTEAIDYIDYANCWWDEDEFNFYIAGQPKATIGQNDAKMGVLTNYENQETIRYIEISLKDKFVPIANYSSSGIFQGTNTIYLGISEKDTTNAKTYFTILKVNLFGSLVTLVDKQTFTHATTTPSDFSLPAFKNIDSQIMYIYYHIAEGKDTSDIQIGRLVDLGLSVENYYKELGLELEDNINFYYNSFFFISKQFNLYNYFISYLDTSYSNKQIYNSENYNGLPYNGLDSLVPNSGILYNSQNEPIFARNLYNKTISGRTTNSTIQVPNSLLNDESIEEENLIGKNNNILIENNEVISKNIYETLNINFLSNISIKNENDPNNIQINLTAASRLNNSVSGKNDYDLAKCTNICAIDSEDKIKRLKIGEENITKISDNMYMYEFIVYNDKKERTITEIHFLSQDEKTDYSYIDGLNLEYGKFYKITQFVEII